MDGAMKRSMCGVYILTYIFVTKCNVQNSIATTIIVVAFLYATTLIIVYSRTFPPAIAASTDLLPWRANVLVAFH